MKKTAKWIRRTQVFKKDEYECAACVFKTDKPKKNCPQCGIQMKGSKYDSSWVDEMVLIDTILDD